MGALPNVYSGYQGVAAPVLREKFEAAWGCELPAEPGLVLTEMFHAMDEGKVKAAYLIGENPVVSDPDARHIEKALSSLEFFVVQDIFMTETAQFADVVLPGVSFAEKEGTFTNTERRVQLSHRAIAPVGDSRPDWQIVCEIARRMGAADFAYNRASEIMEEIAELTPAYGGITYERLEKGGLQWPCPYEDHPGTQYLHADLFVRGKGKFVPIEYRPPHEEPDEDYPLVLTTGRHQFHFHTGTMSRRSEGLTALKGKEELEINPQDAEALGIADGDEVRVTSRRGNVLTTAKVTGRSPQGVVFMTFHFAETRTNLLTNPALDPVSKIPELKVCAARVERVSPGP